MNYSIYAESTPNPMVMKFVANRMIADKSIEILEASKAQDIPIVKELFKLPFVKSVFISSNFVSITKTKNVEWENIAIQIRTYLSDFLNSIEIINHTENINHIENVSKEIVKKEDITNIKEFSKDEKEISLILNEYIKPAVESDGGSIMLHSFKDGVVTVNLRGACSGCPSSSVTLKQGIEQLLKQKLGDKIEEVIANNQ
tara:strand:- start:26342 stop:26941 length:600 start_codon:yes stop_codon:yes gene_type:complete